MNTTDDDRGLSDDDLADQLEGHLETVNVHPLAEEGYLVTCAGCLRTARMPSDPGSKVAICPVCLAMSSAELLAAIERNRPDLA